MKKLYSKCCIGLGTILILSALSLVIYNINQDMKSSQASENVLGEIKNQISYETKTYTEYMETDYYIEKWETTCTETTEEKLLEIDGNYYIGFIEIPSLNIELPVMNEWSYDSLKISPCRYKGSIAENNLIVAAHNYSSHFGDINSLNSDDEIIFTDANGNIYQYRVVNTEIIDGYDISEMDKNDESEWDLTIFTCTLSGQSRVTVRALKNYT